MPRVAPDSNDVVVWRFDEAAAPFVNSSTSPSTAGSLADLGTSVQVSYDGELTTRTLVEGPFGAGSYAVEALGSQSGTRPRFAGANTYYPQPPITISGWLYLYRYDSSFTQHFFVKQQTVNVWFGPFSIVTFSNRIYAGGTRGEMDFGFGTTGTPTVGVSTDQTQPTPLGRWTHVGMTFDGQVVNAYIDGVLVGSADHGSSMTIQYDTSTPGPWWFGAIPSGSGAPEETYGKIADWRIANVVRPASYFANIFTQGQLSWTGKATGASNTFVPRTTYYKLRASCTASPSGYITWVNTTGDDTGKPSCAGTLGPTVIIDQWQA